MFCKHCGKEIHDEAIICPECGCSTQERETEVFETKREDKVSIGMCILSFLIPLVGFIYWPVNHKKTPQRAQACGITACVGFAINFLILLFL